MQNYQAYGTAPNEPKSINNEINHNLNSDNTNVSAGAKSKYANSNIEGQIYGLAPNQLPSTKPNKIPREAPSESPGKISNLASYKSSKYGIKITYPSQWDIARHDEDPYDRVVTIATLYPPGRIPASHARIEIGMETYANTSLYKYLHEIINSYSDEHKYFKLIQSDTNASLSGNSAYILVYNTQEKDKIENAVAHSLSSASISFAVASDKQVMEIGTKVNNMIYYIRYVAHRDEYSSYLPIAQQAIESFEIDPNANVSKPQIVRQLNNISPQQQISLKVGLNPTEVAVNPNTNMVYVTNADSNTVSVIDGKTNSVVKNIEVGKQPSSIAINPNTNMVYVANSNSNTVSVIDGKTNSVKTDIVDNGSEFVALNPNTNMVYVANSNSNTVSVIDGKTNMWLEKITLEHIGYDLAVNPNTNKVYVTNADSNTVSVIDGKTNSVVKNIEVGKQPSSIAINPNTNMVYVVSDYKIVYIIDGNTN